MGNKTEKLDTMPRPKPTPTGKVIKGKLFVDTLKRLAKKYGTHTGACTMVDLAVWYYPEMTTKNDNERFFVRTRLWDSSKSTHFEPIGSQENLRNLAALIDQLIAGDEDEKKEN